MNGGSGLSPIPVPVPRPQQPTPAQPQQPQSPPCDCEKLTKAQVEAMVQAALVAYGPKIVANVLANAEVNISPTQVESIKNQVMADVLKYPIKFSIYDDVNGDGLITDEQGRIVHKLQPSAASKSEVFTQTRPLGGEFKIIVQGIIKATGQN